MNAEMSRKQDEDETLNSSRLKRCQNDDSETIKKKKNTFSKT